MNKHWLIQLFPSLCDGCPERSHTDEPRHARSNGDSDPINFYLDVETHSRLVRLTGEDQADTSKSEILRAMLNLALPLFEADPGMVKILRQRANEK